MTKKIVLFGLFLFCVAGSSFAESGPSPEEEMRKLHEHLRQMEDEHLQELRKRDPEAYQGRIKMRDLSQKISEITSSFQQGRISESIARKELTPLVREYLKESRLKNLDQEIEHLEKRLAFLKKARINPDLLVDQEVDRYLGKGSLEESFPF